MRLAVKFDSLDGRGVLHPDKTAIVFNSRYGETLEDAERWARKFAARPANGVVRNVRIEVLSEEEPG